MRISGTIWLLSALITTNTHALEFSPEVRGFLDAGLLNNKWQMLTLATHLSDSVWIARDAVVTNKCSLL